MKGKDISSSARRQSKKDKDHMIALVCVISPTPHHASRDCNAGFQGLVRGDNLQLLINKCK
jgi:hypothetical protein